MSSILRSLLMSTNSESESDTITDTMYEKSKQTWLDFIEAYKKMSPLWDPKHKDYLNKRVRAQCREKLLGKFKRIDNEATVVTMVKRIGNMRTSYNRERKKVMESIQKGGSPHRPSLWYYDYFQFLDLSDSDTVPQFNTIRHFRQPSAKLKRSPEEFNSSENGSLRTTERIEAIEKEEEEEIQPPPPKRRIYHLLQKQEKFIDTASKLLVRKESEWEIHGKAIGLQLEKLDYVQQTIANKLIADLIYYGKLAKLTSDSYIHIEDVQRLSPETGQVEELEDSDADDNSRESKKELLYVDDETYSNDDDDD